MSTNSAESDVQPKVMARKTERGGRAQREPGATIKPEFSTPNFAPPKQPTKNGLPSPTVLDQQAEQALLVHGYENEAIHPDLRSSNEPPAASVYPPVPNMMPSAVPVPSVPVPSVPPPPEQPAIAHGLTDLRAGAPAGPMDVDVDGDGSPEGRKAKRELSQSKRAAQNRAAQRAFRQRKEGYIKKLEQQVKDYGQMEQSYKQLQSENYTLRQYILNLQGRLLDSTGDFPPPSQNLNLPHPHQVTAHAAHAPHAAPQPSEPAPASSTSTTDTTSLEVVAQAVAGLTRVDHMEREPFPGAKAYKPESRSVEDEARAEEEISRQLQVDSGTEGVPPAPM